jgi:hypothetical protein
VINSSLFFVCEIRIEFSARAAKGMMTSGLDSALKGVAGLDRWRKVAAAGLDR